MRQPAPNPPPPLAPPPVTISFELPLPPSVNNQYATVGNRRVLSQPAQAFKRDVRKMIERARSSASLTPAAERGLRDVPLGVYLSFYFASPRRRDLDGGLKIALDALAASLGFDDRDVVDLHLSKFIDPLRPRLEVQIETIPGWAFDESYVYLGDDGTADEAAAESESKSEPDSD